MPDNDRYDQIDESTNATSRSEAERPDMDAIRAGGTGSSEDDDIGGLNADGMGTGTTSYGSGSYADSPNATHALTGTDTEAGDSGLGGMSDGSSSGSPLHSNVLQDGMTGVGEADAYRAPADDSVDRGLDNLTSNSNVGG